MGAAIEPLDIPALLRQFDLRPKKSLGQNFLVSENALRQVVAAANLSGDETVLEVGPGLGSLTRYLALSAREVVAVELDQRMIEPLNQVLAPFENVRIVHGDILDLDPADLIPDAPFAVVANIPYYITSNLIRHLLEGNRSPLCMVLTLQEEVARRICAAPGDLSILALSVQVYGQPDIAATLPPGSFYPPPKIRSAVLHVDLYPEPLIPAEDLPIFFRLVKAGFSQKRKTLRNALSGGLAWSKNRAVALLEKAGISPQRRAETLEIEEWKLLVEKMKD